VLSTALKRLLAEDVFEIGEAVILRGVVVQRVGTAVRRFDAQIVAQEIARHEVVERRMSRRS
jgi:hypothetical protein